MPSSCPIRLHVAPHFRTTEKTGLSASKGRWQCRPCRRSVDQENDGAHGGMLRITRACHNLGGDPQPPLIEGRGGMFFFAALPRGTWLSGTEATLRSTRTEPCEMEWQLSAKCRHTPLRPTPDQ